MDRLLDLIGVKDRLISPENLNRELFFHAPFAHNATLITTLNKGIPLFNLKGRATLFSGMPGIGDYFVFRIPLLKQGDLIGPSTKDYDDWRIVKGGFALAGHIPTSQMENARNWLRNYEAWIIETHLRERNIKNIPLNDIRCLPAQYCVGYIELYYPEMGYKWKLKVLPGIKSKIDSNLLEQAIHLADRY